MDFYDRIDKLNTIIADARRIVFFTGAGISTGSGIPASQRYGYSLHRMNRHGGIYEVF